MRQFFKGMLLGLCGLAILLGLLWIGQGTGIFPYPAESFMINQPNWAWRGAGSAVIGVLGIGVVRRFV